MPQPSRVSGLVVAVTAAAQGIGRATALTFAAQGAAAVALIDKNAEGLAVTAEGVRARGAKAVVRPTDCTDERDVRTCFTEVTAEAGAIDVLVNGVGQSARDRSSEFWRMDAELWRFIHAVCLETAMLCSRQVVPAMRERRRGRIVNIATHLAHRPDKGFVDYAAAKAGVEGFTRALAIEMAPFGVTVNAVGPGPIRTVAIERLPQDVMHGIIAAVPLGRVGDPEDVANAIAFLASDEASFITGHVLAVNGGLFMG